MIKVIAQDFIHPPLSVTILLLQPNSWGVSVDSAAAAWCTRLTNGIANDTAD